MQHLSAQCPCCQAWCFPYGQLKCTTLLNFLLFEQYNHHCSHYLKLYKHQLKGNIGIFLFNFMRLSFWLALLKRGVGSGEQPVTSHSLVSLFIGYMSHRSHPCRLEKGSMEVSGGLARARGSVAWHLRTPPTRSQNLLRLVGSLVIQLYQE